jgi:hypothetical protein
MDITLKMPELLEAIDQYLKQRNQRTTKTTEIELKTDPRRGGTIVEITDVEFAPIAEPPKAARPAALADGAALAPTPAPKRGLDAPPMTLDEVLSARGARELPDELEEFEGRAASPAQGPTETDASLDSVLKASRALENREKDVYGREPRADRVRISKE